MSSEPTSRVNPDPVRTLADVLAAVQTADLPKQRRQEIASALRTAARAIGKPLERVPAAPRRLQALLSEVSPIALGLSPGRWANVRSGTRAGLALVQPMMPGRHITPLSPGWKALWQQLPRKIRRPLSRFARFCSVRSNEPEGVTDAVIAAFNAYLNDSLLKSPDKIFAAMACAWRAAQTTVDGWPQIAITIPNRRRDWTLPWSHFPASLQRDCASWCDRLAGCDPLAEGPVRIVRPGTVAHRERQIRTFASALALQGRDPATLTSLRDLVEIDALKAGLMFLIERSGGKRRRQSMILLAR